MSRSRHPNSASCSSRGDEALVFASRTLRTAASSNASIQHAADVAEGPKPSGSSAPRDDARLVLRSADHRVCRFRSRAPASGRALLLSARRTKPGSRRGGAVELARRANLRAGAGRSRSPGRLRSLPPPRRRDHLLPRARPRDGARATGGRQAASLSARPRQRQQARVRECPAPLRKRDAARESGAAGAGRAALVLGHGRRAALPTASARRGAIVRRVARAAT